MAAPPPPPPSTEQQQHPRVSPPAMPRARLHPDRPALARYAVSLAVWLVALAVTLALASYVQRANFVFFWIAVLFAAWYGGLVPALLAAFASVLAVNYYFVPPLHHFRLRSVADLLTLGIFIGASMTVAALTAALSRAQRRALRRASELSELATQLEEHAVDLERQTEAAQELAQELEHANEELESTAEETEQARHVAETERARLQSVLDGMPDVVNGYDDDWRWTYMNPAARAHFRAIGRDPDALVGRRVWDEFPEAVGTKFHVETLRAIAEQRVVEYDEQDPQGGGRWFENRVVPIAGGAITFSREVTARKRAELGERLLAEAGALFTSSTDYRAMLQRVAELAVPALADWCGVEVVNDATGELEQVAVAHRDPERARWARELRRRYPPPADGSTGTYAVVRTGRSELIPLVSDEMLAAAAVDAEHLRVLREVGFHSLVIVPMTARGRTLGALALVWAESGRRYDDADVALAEELARRAATAIDNARLFAAEQAARRAAEAAADRVGRLQSVTATLARAVTMPDVADAVVSEGISALGATDGVLYLAGDDGQPLELVRSHGLPAATAREFHWLPLDAQTPMAEAVRMREPVFLEDRNAVVARYPSIRASNARVRADAWAALPLVAGARAVGGMAFGFTAARPFSSDDRAFLTALAQQCAVALERARLYEAESAARADAERARAAAEAASRAKSEFLATMSHELRTPLNAIGGYAELLEMGIHGPVTDAQRDALARVRRSQRVLLALINDVLNLARIEAGTVDYVVESVALDEALEEVEAMVAPQVAAKGLRYEYDERCAPGVRVRADRDKLRQIVLNLLSNAIKFTDHGGVVRLTCDASDDVVARVRVHDTGRGIPETHLESIFEPFVQVDSSYTRTADGTGLGLAISRDLAQAMDAELTLERSQVGEGSTFVLSLRRG
ncbi:MAG TPA: GAF domain-containing protein [Gemmatimonadaceae bacterium]|nr:GAF domain-containing protein [Gemmatimonadaceae bacterium]